MSMHTDDNFASDDDNILFTDAIYLSFFCSSIDT